MAASPSVRNARKSLLGLLVILVALGAIIAVGVFRGSTTLAPKLALDLQGGTQILLAPKQTDGSQVTGEQLNQAVSIIRQRVDASGVSEAEITTQGNQNIVVSIPGKADEETLQRIEASAKMDMRVVLLYAPADVDTEAAEDPDNSDGENELAQDSAESDATQQEESENETSDTEKPEGYYPDPLPEDPSDQGWLTEGLLSDFSTYTCDAEAHEQASTAAPDKPLITCDTTGTAKYILGPVEQDQKGHVLSGESILDAQAQQATDQNGAVIGGWGVQLKLNESGTKLFGEMSTRILPLAEPFNQFAFVLDGNVLIAPRMQGAILDGRPSITGEYSQEEAQSLADQLKFGALPIGFTVQSQEDISATLGSSQLQVGLLTGLVGFVLVMLYSFGQYRVLGLVTVASLVMAGIITYLLLIYMSWRHGYRLSLAGVAGVMVAVGFTADSFIVYFERIRDELRDGRMIGDAVDAGWRRAIRTILASDGINLLAAIILFILAVGNVQGFAFTLGLTTLVDVIVVTLFTHPLLVLLARTKFYQNGHKLSGLDPRQLGAVYRGRAQFKTPERTAGRAGRKAHKSQKEAQRRQTIAERKAAEAGHSTEEAK